LYFLLLSLSFVSVQPSFFCATCFSSRLCSLEQINVRLRALERQNLNRRRGSTSFATAYASVKPDRPTLSTNFLQIELRDGRWYSSLRPDLDLSGIFPVRGSDRCFSSLLTFILPFLQDELQNFTAEVSEVQPFMNTNLDLLTKRIFPKNKTEEKKKKTTKKPTGSPKVESSATPATPCHWTDTHDVAILSPHKSDSSLFDDPNSETGLNQRTGLEYKLDRLKTQPTRFSDSHLGQAFTCAEHILTLQPTRSHVIYGCSDGNYISFIKVYSDPSKKVEESPLFRLHKEGVAALASLMLEPTPISLPDISNLTTKYSLTQFLGKGAFSSVYAAETEDGDTVAIKAPWDPSRIATEVSFLNSFKAIENVVHLVESSSSVIVLTPITQPLVNLNRVLACQAVMVGFFFVRLSLSVSR
jgi:hypothetical protein